MAALLAAGCDRGSTSRGSEPALTGGGAQTAAPTASASTPPGTTNPSTAAHGNDLSNSTRATGSANVYEPPSSNNPPPGGAPVAGAAASAASQSVSSLTRGTQPPADDGTLPGGVQGNSASRSSGGSRL